MYWISKLNCSCILEPHLQSEIDVQTFRAMTQLETKALISGSTALQVFARKRCIDSDLDILSYDSFSGLIEQIIILRRVADQNQT